ncbi:MAG: VIT domain-containing protein [Elainellaceae cyanobacterium]
MKTRPPIAPKNRFKAFGKAAPLAVVALVPAAAIAIVGLRSISVAQILGTQISENQTLGAQTPGRRLPVAEPYGAEPASPADAAAPQPSGLYASEGQAFTLQHTDMQAQISGNLARVEVTQTFENPFDEALEAVYVFPLPDEAAVDDMEIRVGDRVIQGDIKRREEAQEIYDQAQEEGRTAGLLEQERANIFTQSVANIRPGEAVEVTLRYTESLTFEGDSYEFVFPTVVGPRYIPGSPLGEVSEAGTDQVPDAGRITPPILPPEVRSGHDLSATVRFDGDMPIQGVRSPSHELLVSDRVRSEGGVLETTQVQLAPNDTIPNKDFILRYRVSGETTQAALLTQADDRGGHFAFYLIPALDYRPEEIVPKDVVFLIDTSGSQQGAPLAQSKRLMARMLEGLNPDDTFTIIDFANTTTRLSPTPLANTANNRRRAAQYVETLTASGGTELLNGVKAVLSFPPAPEGRLRSVVLLTDGYIGNEAAVIDEVRLQLQAGNRLYSFGVGSSVNRFLLDRLGEVGRGLSLAVRQDEPVEAVIDRFLGRISNPVLTNLEVTWEGVGDSVIYPQAPPDLFDQQPLVIFGRVGDRQPGRLRVTGTLANGEPYETVLPVRFDEAGNPAIAQLWGRARIKDAMLDMAGGETVSGVEAVTQTALDYRLLSAYTAFVAVSEEVRVDPDGTRRRVEVPVALPEGVSYEGIFGPGSAETGAVPTGAAASRLQSAPAPMTGADMSSPRMPALPTAPPVAESTIAPEAESAEAQVSVEVEGLDVTLDAETRQQLVASLEAQLQGVAASGAASGTASGTASEAGAAVWRLRLQQGRVVQVLLDEEATTLQARSLLTELRQRLQGWRSPVGLEGLVRVSIEIGG